MRHHESRSDFYLCCARPAARRPRVPARLPLQPRRLRAQCSVHSLLLVTVQRCSTSTRIGSCHPHPRRERTDVRTGADPLPLPEDPVRGVAPEQEPRERVPRSATNSGATRRSPNRKPARPSRSRAVLRSSSSTNMARLSSSWSHHGENPMPKPPSADASSSGGAAARPGRRRRRVVRLLNDTVL